MAFLSRTGMRFSCGSDVVQMFVQTVQPNICRRARGGAPPVAWRAVARVISSPRRSSRISGTPWACSSSASSKGKRCRWSSSIVKLSSRRLFLDLVFAGERSRNNLKEDPACSTTTASGE